MRERVRRSAFKV